MLTVLVIDDDDDLRGLLVDIISREEHLVVAAESAEKGLELLPHTTFQVAFVDQNLPGMDGLLLGEYLRRNNPQMTIALVTGSDDRKLPKATEDLDIEYIPKPFTQPDILRVLVRAKQRLSDHDALRAAASADHFAPNFVSHLDALALEIPKSSDRVEAKLVENIRRLLANLRHGKRYNESDRATALAALLSARVLGISLPVREGLTLYQEYDAIMRTHGRRTEFE